MKLDKYLNVSIVLAFIAVAVYSHVAEGQKRVDEPIKPVMAKPNPEQKYQAWQLKSGSIDEGIIRVFKGSREIEVKFCGVKLPEKQQELGIQARNHLKSLIDKGDGSTVYITPVKRDIQGRTIAELFVVMGNKTALFLNSQMIADGYAWHDEKHSSNCPSRRGLVIAEQVAKDKKLGVWK
jgi:endonuclease YncB( thermonuclease family)